MLEAIGKRYQYVDPWRRIKFGPHAFDCDVEKPKLPQFLEEILDCEIYSNDVLKRIFDYLKEKVYQNELPEIKISWGWNMHEMSAGEYYYKKNEPDVILLNKHQVKCRLYAYLVIAHEMAHADVAHNTTCDDTYHGNPFIKACEKFLAFDDKMDVYMPDRSVFGNIQFIYECTDEYCRKYYNTDNEMEKCTCGKD